MSRSRRILFVILFIFISGITFYSYADENKKPVFNEADNFLSHLFSVAWTPVQLSCTPVALFNNTADVYGTNIALLLGTMPENVYGLNYAGIANFVWNRHCGISVSGIWTVMNKNYGISIAPANMVAENFGVMLGFVNTGPMDDTNGYGVQVGLVNQAKSGLQIGLLNYNANALLPWMLLINCSFE